jgi:hypothetical protein
MAPRGRCKLELPSCVYEEYEDFGGLKKRVMWLSKAIEVREEVVSYFKKHFEEIT